MMILGCRALSGDGRILLGGITVRGEGGTRNDRTEVSTEGKGWIKGNDMWSGWLWGLGHPRDRELKGERPERGREEEVILPHRKVGSAEECKRARGEAVSRAGMLNCK